MYNLVIVVLVIALTALIVAGGVNYLSPDLGPRRETTEKVILSYRAFEGAFAAYRVSNNGALPLPSSEPATNHDASPWWQLGPFLVSSIQARGVNGALLAPEGMDWFYVSEGGSTWLCLVGTDTSLIGDGVKQGLHQAAGRVGRAYMTDSCAGSESSPPSDTGGIALKFRIHP